MKDRRIGEFFIGRELIETNPKLVKDIMGQCIIIKAEFSYHRDGVEYTAISDWFDECKSNCMPQTYGFYFVCNKGTGRITKWMFSNYGRIEYA